jgi:hypothetical protein
VIAGHDHQEINEKIILGLIQNCNSSFQLISDAYYEI